MMLQGSVRVHIRSHTLYTRGHRDEMEKDERRESAIRGERDRERDREREREKKRAENRGRRTKSEERECVSSVGLCSLLALALANLACCLYECPQSASAEPGR